MIKNVALSSFPEHGQQLCMLYVTVHGINFSHQSLYSQISPYNVFHSCS